MTTLPIFNKPIYLFIISMMFALNVHSQTSTQVVTKEITRTINADSRSVTINAEKADIFISESKDQNLYLKMKFISKHKNIDIAKEQIDFLHHVINVSKKEIFLHNYILIASGEKLQANIKVQYFLQIPNNKKMYLKNTMGELKISKHTGFYDIKIKYGKLFIENSAGIMNAEIHIGDIFIKNSSFKSDINTSHSTCNFTNNIGEYILKTNLGTVNFELSSKISKLVLNSNGTDIILNNKYCSEFNFDIESNLGEININECFINNTKNIISDTRTKSSNKKVFRYTNNGIRNYIKIINKFSNIYIN